MTITRESLVEYFAYEVADLQRRADVAYYTANDQDTASALLNSVITIQRLCAGLLICADVWAKAKQIYDFSNSGKAGYTLKNGRIVKED